MRAHAKLSPEFIRVPSAGGTADIKINVRKPVERKGRQKGRVRKNRSVLTSTMKFLRNISRSQLPAVGPARSENRRRKLRKSRSATRSRFKFLCFALSSRSSPEKFNDRTDTSDAPFLREGNNFPSVSFYATHSLERGYQFALNRMNFYGFSSFLSFFFLLFFFYIERSFIFYFVVRSRLLFSVLRF